MTASGKPSLTSQTVKLSILSVSVVFADFLLGSLPSDCELRC